MGDLGPLAAPITVDQIPAVVETLALAFMDDPVWSHIFDDELKRLDQLRQIWTFSVTSAMRYDWMMAMPDAQAAALWIPPGGTEFSAEEDERFEPFMRTLLGPRTSEVMDLFQQFDDAHPHDREHYYLSLLGTNPAARGRGLGMALLAENLRSFDAQGAPAYLESSNAVNLERYGRLGFKPVGSFRVGTAGPVITTMWREPREVA